MLAEEYLGRDPAHKITKEKCRECGQIVPIDDMTKYDGMTMCEGCAESEDLYSHDDPCGKGWEP